MKRTVARRAVIFVLLFCWMALIFYFSAQPADESSELSGGFVTAIIKAVYPTFDALSQQQQAHITDILSFIVRKTAHFSEYFVLGVLSFWAVDTLNERKEFVKALTAFVFCVIYSASDEFHQYFVPGRACRFVDVLIDLSGSLTAIILLAFILYKIRNTRDKSGGKMRKKDLIQQNLSLFDNLQKTKIELNELKKQLKVYAAEIENLKAENTQKSATETVVTEPMRRLEEKVISAASLKPDVEYGAKVIGEIVVSAADYSNKLTANGDNTHKELVNLILGKTEVAKSEILSVTETQDSFENKCSKIDNIASDTKEYFESVLAQII